MVRRDPSFSLLGLLVILISHTCVQAAPTAAPNGTRSNKPISPDTRIVNGQKAEEGQFPWQASIVQDDSFFCGGSIIDPQWILTAAHCVYKVLVFEVTVGTIYSGKPPRGTLEPGRQTILSNIGIPHPLYVSSSQQDDNDVGLVRLPTSLIFTKNVAAIPLATPTPQYLNLDLKVGTVSGWGKTSDLGSVSTVLQWTDLTIIPGLLCTGVYGDIRMDQKICCSALDGDSTCNGDSGGPLIMRGDDGTAHQIGIVSYGSDSCVRRIPVVFTRVTYFLDFIDTVTGLKSQEDPSTSHAKLPIPLKWLRRH